MASSQSTQEFIPFKEIRDGLVVLKDGSLRAILMVSSINISLKSHEEQEMVLLQFQTFLNSLEFSIQIHLQSRRLDIRPYLALLEEKEREQVNELMKIQVGEYIKFIKNFTETTNIMSKTFFVVVPFTPSFSSAGAKKGVLSALFPSGKKTTTEATQDKLEEFEENKTQIEQRVSVVDQGLSHIGLRAAKLGTEEIIELFYKIFNPGELEKPVQLAQLS